MEELTSSEKMSKGANLFFEGLVETMKYIADSFIDTFSNLWPTINPVFELMNKTMTKNKFKGMLQAAGIQRNQINIIVANNKDPYTYKRLSEVLKLHGKDRYTYE